MVIRLNCFRDGPDPSPTHFDPSAGNQGYFHGGAGGFHSNFPPNVHSAGGGDQFGK